MKTKTVPLDTLVPDPDNTRIHPEENLQAIQWSLEKFGQVLPLVVHAESQIVVGGNGTVRAMERLGWTDAAVVLYTGTLEEARALSIALNRTGDLAEWDEEGLSKALIELHELGFNHEELGFSTEDLDEMSPVDAEGEYRADTGGDIDAPQKSSEPATGLGTLVVRYDLIFDTETQQKRFFGFLRHLKNLYPNEETNAARLDLHLQAVLEE